MLGTDIKTIRLDFPRYAFDDEHGLVRLDCQQDLLYLTRYMPQESRIELWTAAKLCTEARRARKYAERDADVERRSQKIQDAAHLERLVERIESGDVQRIKK